MKREDKTNSTLLKAANKIHQVLETLNVYNNVPDYMEKHLKDTPLRIVTAWEEFTKNLATEIDDPTSFDEEVVDGIPIIRKVRFSSLCIHHFFPFSGIAHVAYLPGEKLIGLSKIPRIVKFIAKRPTLQEFLTRDVADMIFERGKPQFVMVITIAEHSCCSCRGIESDSDMVFSSIRWDSKLNSSDVSSLKSEVLSLIKLKNK